MDNDDNVRLSQDLVLSLRAAYKGAFTPNKLASDPSVCRCRCHQPENVIVHPRPCCEIAKYGSRIRTGGMGLHIERCLICKKKIVEEALQQTGTSL